MKSSLTYQILLALLLQLLAVSQAWADGTFTHLSGTVSVQKSGGQTLPGTVGTKVSAGDTIITGAMAYVRMEMSDGGEMVLRPNSHLKIERYKYTQAKPAEDSFTFSMLKGGLRTVTGLIGKRGNRDAYRGQTATATIGIRGTQYDLRVCQANCGALADGTYLAVRFGAIQTSNVQGALNVAAGQVAYIASQRPPVLLPRDPGIGFTPPMAIPKLDEKKKVQATAAATTTNAPDQAVSAASSSSSATSDRTGDSTSTQQLAAPAEASASPATSSVPPQSSVGEMCSVE